MRNENLFGIVIILEVFMPEERLLHRIANVV